LHYTAGTLAVIRQGVEALRKPVAYARIGFRPRTHGTITTLNPICTERSVGASEVR
jgi:hypothetical protein